jgi:uncharacterized protein YceH (UPF0502 family)
MRPPRLCLTTLAQPGVAADYSSGRPICSIAMDLSAAEIRVLGSLVEKQLTTPQQYPLTLNALTLACSQSSNRDPVVDYDERSTEEAVTSVKTRGLVRFVHPSHGRSALRYAHTLDEALGLDTRPMALLAVLMLRGPQTLGELRTRTERMVRFADLHEVQAELEALGARTEPLVLRLARGPGQKEDRYGQLLGGSVSETPSRRADAAPAPVGPDTEAAGAHGRSSPAPSDETAALRSEISELRAEVGALRRALDDLREQLGA